MSTQFPFRQFDDAGEILETHTSPTLGDVCVRGRYFRSVTRPRFVLRPPTCSRMDIPPFRYGLRVDSCGLSGWEKRTSEYDSTVRQRFVVSTPAHAQSALPFPNSGDLCLRHCPETHAN